MDEAQYKRYLNFAKLFPSETTEVVVIDPSLARIQWEMMTSFFGKKAVVEACVSSGIHIGEDCLRHLSSDTRLQHINNVHRETFYRALDKGLIAEKGTDISGHVSVYESMFASKDRVSGVIDIQKLFHPDTGQVVFLFGEEHLNWPQVECTDMTDESIHITDLVSEMSDLISATFIEADFPYPDIRALERRDAQDGNFDTLNLSATIRKIVEKDPSHFKRLHFTDIRTNMIQMRFIKFMRGLVVRSVADVTMADAEGLVEFRKTIVDTIKSIIYSNWYNPTNNLVIGGFRGSMFDYEAVKLEDTNKDWYRYYWLEYQEICTRTATFIAAIDADKTPMLLRQFDKMFDAFYGIAVTLMDWHTAAKMVNVFNADGEKKPVIYYAHSGHVNSVAMRLIEGYGFLSCYHLFSTKEHPQCVVVPDTLRALPRTFQEWSPPLLLSIDKIIQDIIEASTEPEEFRDIRDARIDRNGTRGTRNPQRLHARSRSINT